MADILNPTAWSETDASNSSGTLPSFPEGMPGKDVNNAARAMQGALKRAFNQIYGTQTTSGSGSTFTVAYSVAPEALYVGQRFTIVANVDFGIAPTLNINSLGAKTIKKVNNGVVTDLAANEIKANTVLDLMYATGGYFIWINPALTVSTIPDASTTVKGIVELATRAEAISGGSLVLGITPDALSSLLNKGLDVAGAATISLGEGGYFVITGTSFTCTSMVFTAASPLGRKALIRFASSGGILTHNATSLALPGAANITVQAGDFMQLVLDNGANYKVSSYTRSGAAAGTSAAEAQVNKPSDETVTSSITLQADDHLKFTPVSGKTYDFELMVYVTSGGGTDDNGIRLAFSGSISVFQAIYLKGGSIDNDKAYASNVAGTAVLFPLITGEVFYAIAIKGTLTANGVTPINLTWAQENSDAVGTTVKAGSYFKYKER